MPNLNNLSPVERGIALLDDKGPSDWRERVNLDHLNLGSVTDCILGQVYGDYNTGLDALGIEDTYTNDERDRYFYGFSSEGYEYDSLTEAWREALSPRRKRRGIEVRVTEPVTSGITGSLFVTTGSHTAVNLSGLNVKTMLVNNGKEVSFRTYGGSVPTFRVKVDAVVHADGERMTALDFYRS